MLLVSFQFLILGYGRVHYSIFRYIFLLIPHFRILMVANIPTRIVTFNSSFQDTRLYYYYCERPPPSFNSSFQDTFACFDTCGCSCVLSIPHFRIQLEHEVKAVHVVLSIPHFRIPKATPPMVTTTMNAFQFLILGYWASLLVSSTPLPPFNSSFQDTRQER